MSRSAFGWGAVARIGLVQAAIGAVIVLMTSTVNRVMVVELHLPASIPGLLVGLHYAVQLVLRPRFGFASDGARRTPWIVGGLGLLVASGIGAAAATMVIASSRGAGIALAVLAFVGLGAGVSAAGTPLLALLAERVDPVRRSRAAAVVWCMMIAGFIVATVAASRMLEPFTFTALVRAVAVVSVVAVGIACVALVGLEGASAPAAVPSSEAPSRSFRAALRVVRADRMAWQFAGFILLSMIAFSAQDLILEPFLGTVFGLSPAVSTRVSSMHQQGILLGILATAALAARYGTLRGWAAAGCTASAVALIFIAGAPISGNVAVLRASIFALGLGNGMFTVGAVGAMMAMSVDASGADAGMRMGVFGGAQAIGFAVGGLIGAVASDIARLVLGSVTQGYSAVFVGEAVLFAVSAVVVSLNAQGPERVRLSDARSAEPMLGAMG